MIKAKALLLLGLLASSLQSFAQEYEDWFAGETDDKTQSYAATVNEDGFIFGQFCKHDTAMCHWILWIDVSCSTKAMATPVIISTGSKAANGNVYCENEKRTISPGKVLYKYSAGPFEVVDAEVRVSEMISFGIAMAGHQYVSVKFSAKGAVPALIAMRNKVFDEHRTSTKSVRF